MNRSDAGANPSGAEAPSSSFGDAGPATTTPGSEEKSSQHGKRALVVAALLGALVVGGLVVDAMRSPVKPAKAANSAAQAPVPQDPFIDFEAKQRMEAARLESERQKKLAQDKARQASRAQEMLSDAPPGATGAPPPRSREDEVRDTARLDDLKRALAAVNSHEMLVTPPRERVAGGESKGGAAGAAAAGGLRSVSATDAGRTPEATLSRLRQAIDRVRGAGGSGASNAAADGARFVRDLRGPDASGAVVGQSASARRERGDAQRSGEYLVPVGTVMAAVLDMEINSDWEGRWRAMVTRDIYDLSQDVILIPKGTRVLGTSARPKPVNEAINERMALVAQWLVLPNGARVDLTRSATLDAGGVAAVGGDVNHHFLATLGGVVAYGVIAGWGAERAARSVDNNNASLAIGALGGRTAGAEIALGLADVGKRVAGRYLNLVPTITIHPGTPINIFLDDEMYLQPWAPIDEFAPAVATPAMR
ncbi:MAG TPA: TrbI/VirB10 family protein [Albitalea sp.]|nr:TrbI/VirB10 family protein [Albitalea sp.]